MEPLNGSNGILKSSTMEYEPEAGGMGKVFFSKMSTYGNAVAQIDGLTGQKDTYSSLLQRCIRTAIVLRSKRITLQDIITICSFNHLNSCVPFIASLFVGAKPSNLDPSISLQDTIFLLKQVCPKIVFVGPEATELIQNALREAHLDAEIVVFGSSGNHTEFSEFLKPSVEEANFTPVEVENIKDTAAILFSSGTTGYPKGICLSHLGLLSQGYAFTGMGFNTNIVLGYASLYWISSAVLLTNCIITKACRIVVPKYDPTTIWSLLERHKVTFMFLAPSQAIAMCKGGRLGGINTANFADLIVGGSIVSKEQIEKIRNALPGTNVLVGYGLTEASGSGIMFQPRYSEDMNLAYEKSESCGKPIPGLSYKIVDIETEKILGPKQKGELRIKTDYQMNGYYNLDSSNAWDSDGWMKTGDVAYYDDDHCFYIVDRIKEMLKFQSWHVSPAAIEEVLLTHPAIEAAVVVGIPHSEDGEHPLGVVVLKKSFVGTVNEVEIEQYVEKRVHDRLRLRGGVKVIERLPLTPSGKVKRRDIRDMFTQGHKS